MSSPIRMATEMAEAVYKDFLEKVIQNHVINNRCTSEDQQGRELSDKEKKLIKEEKIFDPRVVRLMSISGKGGWHNDPEKQARYGRNDNVTLLDHLLSVTRGSLMLASLDWLNRNPNMDDELLKRKLYVIAALAFMHDIDKDLCISRITDVSDAEVQERMTLYGINEFLETVEVKLAPDQLLYLIDKVESLQANRRLPTEMPPRYADGTLPLYVRLADKLDGIWLSEEGIEGVLNRLKNDKSCIRSNFLCQLFDKLDTSSPIIDLFDPHHPFLMDELQRRLSKFTQNETGAPPLIEIHHDGRLVMLMLANKSQLAQIKEQAIQDLTESLAESSFQLQLNVLIRGEPELLNRQPSHAQLEQFISKHPHDKDFQKIFLIKRALKEQLKPLDDLLNEFDLNPIFPSSQTGQTMTLYASVEKMSIKAKKRLKKAAHAILLLNLLLKPNPMSYDDREKAFLALIPEERPDWITAIENGHSRRVLTALWAITIDDDDKAIDKAIWGEEGLLQQWLEGTPDKKGFNQFIKAEGDSTIQAIENYFRQLFFSGKCIQVENEAAEGRCLFTDQPVDDNKRLQENMGLRKVGIKASAFSGRDNRPEYFDTSSSGHTNISPISMAEQQLRVRVHSKQSARNIDNTPTLIYSPTTIGLFGGLAMNVDQDMQNLSLEELSNFEVKRSKIMGIEHYKGRYRIMRFEHLPGKTADQVNQLHRLLKANLRIGRPIHVFRGLPTANRAFFHYDAMPSLLAELLSDGKSSGNSLRLEQIPSEIQRLEMAKLLLGTWGYGYNALQLYANPKTRFRGICFAWCGLYEKHRWIANRLLLEYEGYFKQGELKMRVDVTEEDGVMVKLGRIAAKIQHYPKKGFQSSKSEQMMVLNNCLAVLSEGFRMPKPQTDRLSLINGIAERLEIMLARGNLVAAAEHRDGISFQEACIEVATFFVDEFWNSVMNQRFPSQDNLRFLKSVYRMSFMRRAKKTDNGDDHE